LNLKRVIFMVLSVRSTTAWKWRLSGHRHS